MPHRRWRVAPLTVAVAVLVGLAGASGFVLARHSVQSQNQALLTDDATQAAGYVSSLISTLGSTLDALAPGVTASGGSPVAFDLQARSLASGPLTLALARRSGADYVVVAVTGSGLTAGELLRGPLAHALATAGPNLTPGPVMHGSTGTVFGFAVGPPIVPTGLALYEQVTLDPFVATTATQAQPFHVLDAAVYASRRPQRSQLVLANTRSLSITGPTTEVRVPVGSGAWWLVAAARSPLAGTFANTAPLIVLAGGIVLALAVGSAVEVVVRRQRYASNLVELRTSELLASQEALVRSERLSAVGQMTTVVGHELRNPLGAVANALYLLRRSLGDPPATEALLDAAERQMARAVALAQDLTAYMRERDPELGPVELRDVLREVLEATPPPPDVTTTQDLDDVELNADVHHIAQVFTNLILNAYQAMPNGGELRIVARSEGRHVTISIADTGEGIDQAAADRLFEPFFTTKSEGTGLGLAIVRRIVDAHGGHVTIENGEAAGTVVTLVLPLETSPQLVHR